MDKDFRQQGFTLIETFVAITILMVLIVGPLGSLAKSVNDTQYARNLATATYLSQDALNTIGAFLQNAAQVTPGGPNSFEGYANAWNINCTTATPCGVQTHLQFPTVARCSINFMNSCRLRRNTDGLYQHIIGTDTPFVRRVVISSLPTDLDIWTSGGLEPPSVAPREVRVSVTTEWQEGAQLRQVSTSGIYWSSQVSY